MTSYWTLMVFLVALWCMGHANRHQTVRMRARGLHADNTETALTLVAAIGTVAGLVMVVTA